VSIIVNLLDFPIDGFSHTFPFPPLLLLLLLLPPRYCLMGPLSASAETEVEFSAPTSPALAKTIESMASQGAKVRV